MKKLSQGIQQAGETYTSNIEDVLPLCRRANKDMSGSDKVKHLMKVISTLAFYTRAVQNPTSVREVTTICKRLVELQSARLQQDSPPALFSSDADLRSLMRSIIREELQAYKNIGFSGERQLSPGPNLRDLVREELHLLENAPPADHTAPQHVPQ